MSTYTQAADDFMRKTGTTMKVKFLRYGRHFHDDRDFRNIYRITLERQGQRMVFNFGQSLNNTAKNIAPDAYGVLACLTKYEVAATVEDFAHEFGYSIDDWIDRMAVRGIWLAVQQEYEDVMRVFGDVIEELSEIQ